MGLGSGRTLNSRNFRKFWLNLVPRPADAPLRALFPGSGQQQVRKRDQGGGGADQNQGVIGSEIVLHVERCLVGRCHPRLIGQWPGGLCEVIHIRLNFFPTCSPERVSGSAVGWGFSDRNTRWP